MSDVDLVDFLIDVKSNDSTKVPRELVSFGKMNEIARISKSIVGHSIFDSDEIAELEEEYFKMLSRAHKGKLRADSVHLKRKEKQIICHFGNGYRLGRDEDEEAKMRNQKDISPIPDWIQERIISKMVQTKIVPEGWIDSVEIIDYAKNGYRIPSMDPISLFMRPSLTLTLLADSAICFGAKFFYDSRPKFSDPRFRLPAYRGVIYKCQGSASDEMNNCVRPCDTDDRAVMMTFRRACPDAPILKPISDGESLRNFDTLILEKVRKFLEPSLESRPLPYIRNFQLKIGNEKKKETKDRKRTQKEQLSFLFQKSKTKKKSPERPIKTKDDEYWKFGASPEKPKTEWSSDEEVDKRTGEIRSKRKETRKTTDISDIVMDYSSRRSTSREKDNRTIERNVHMKKSRKERGREFRSTINEKFGFKPSIVQSDESEEEEAASSIKRDQQKRPRAFYL